MKKPPEGGFCLWCIRGTGLLARPKAYQAIRLSGYQAEKLEPHPQVVVALGFLITNWAPCRSSL